MSQPRVNDSKDKWKPKVPEKWHRVPTNPDGLPDPLQQNPFDPEDPAGDWGAFLDPEGRFVVDYCDEEAGVPWADLYPPAPAVNTFEVHIDGSESEAGQKEEDVEVEITERHMWYREYRCAFVIQTSMTWKVTRQKWICDDTGLPVSPGGPGVWRKVGGQTVETVSLSRKTEFRCC